MKKIILSALLASTVAMTAFAGDNPTKQGTNVENLLRDVAVMSEGSDSVAASTNVRFDLSSTNGTLLALQQAAPSADVTEVSAKGEDATTPVAAYSVMFPGSALIYCVSFKKDSQKNGKGNAVVCGPNLKSSTSLMNALALISSYH